MKYLLPSFLLLFFSSSLHAQTALSFDPSAGDQMVEIKNISCPDALSFEAWIYFKGSNGTYVTILEFGNDEPWFGLEEGDEEGIYYLTLYPGVIDTIPFQTDEWVHVAGTFSNVDSIARIYVNGELRGMETSAEIEVNGVGAGIAYYGTDDIFNGYIDDLRIWNVVRSQEEISANMRTCLSGTESGLYAFYHFDEGTGSILYDQTSNAFHGTLIDMDTTTAWVSYTNCWPAGTEELELSKISIYPNPATNSLQISGINGKIQYQICNAIGEVVLEGQAYNQSLIDLQTLSSGFYYIRLSDGRTVKFCKS